MLYPPSARSPLVDIPASAHFTLVLLLSIIVCLPGNAYAQPGPSDPQPTAVCIVNPQPPSPAFSGTTRSTPQRTWICDPRSDLYTASVSPAPFGEQRIDGVAYTMVGLLGMSGSALLITGGILAVRADTPIDAVGVAMIVAGGFAGGAGIWTFTKGMRILFRNDPG